MPTADRVRLGSAFGLAACLIALLSLVRPDLSEWSEAVRPYFETTNRAIPERDGRLDRRFRSTVSPLTSRA